MPKTEAAICYLLRMAAPGKLSKTALIKLCYFADLENTRRSGEPITESSWQRDEFGAVEYAIPNAARDIRGVDVFDYTTHTGNHGTDFCVSDDLHDIEAELSMNEKAVLGYVWASYGGWTAVRLGAESKKTKPWIVAEKTGVSDLDLSVASPGPEGRFAHFAQVLESVDMSVRGTPEQIVALEDETDCFMVPFRLEALVDG
jgi:uncharacterized phage-associated protein